MPWGVLAPALVPTSSPVLSPANAQDESVQLASTMENKFFLSSLSFWPSHWAESHSLPAPWMGWELGESSEMQRGEEEAGGCSRRAPAQPLIQRQGGRQDLLRAVALLSIFAGTCWAGLFYWEGRSKIGKAARSCPVRTLLRGWQRCLSGKIRIYLGMKGREHFKGSRLQLFHCRGNRIEKLRGLSPS